MIIYIIVLLCFLSAASAVGSGLWQARAFIGESRTKVYVLLSISRAGYGKQFEGYLPNNYTVSDPVAVGVIAFFGFVLLYNTLVPISLYVSVEVIRFVQFY